MLENLNDKRVADLYDLISDKFGDKSEELFLLDGKPRRRQPRDERGLEVSYFFLFLFLFFSFLFGGGIGFKMTRSRRTTRARGTCTENITVRRCSSRLDQSRSALHADVQVRVPVEEGVPARGPKVVALE